MPRAGDTRFRCVARFAENRLFLCFFARGRTFFRNAVRNFVCGHERFPRRARRVRSRGEEPRGHGRGGGRAADRRGEHRRYPCQHLRFGCERDRCGYAASGRGGRRRRGKDICRRFRVRHRYHDLFFLVSAPYARKAVQKTENRALSCVRGGVRPFALRAEKHRRVCLPASGALRGHIPRRVRGGILFAQKISPLRWAKGRKRVRQPLSRVFDDEFFRQHDEEIHACRQNAQDKSRRHDEVEFEDLPAVYDEITEPRFRDDVFAHDRADPCHADAYFQHSDKVGQRGGDHELGQDLQFARAHGTEQGDLVFIRREEAAEHVHDGDDDADEDGHEHDCRRTRAEPDDDDGPERDFRQAVQNDDIRL